MTESKMLALRVLSIGLIFVGVNMLFDRLSGIEGPGALFISGVLLGIVFSSVVCFFENRRA